MLFDTKSLTIIVSMITIIILAAAVILCISYLETKREKQRSHDKWLKSLKILQENTKDKRAITNYITASENLLIYYPDDHIRTEIEKMRRENNQ